jgi:hypothetical protein
LAAGGGMVDRKEEMASKWWEGGKELKLEAGKENREENDSGITVCSLYSQSSDFILVTT